MQITCMQKVSVWLWKKNFFLHSAKFLLTSELAWEAILKNIKVELEQFTDIDISFMVNKGISRRLCYSIIDMKMLIINLWKILIKIKNHPMNNLYG